MPLARNLAFMVTGSKLFSKQGYLKAAKTFDQTVLQRDMTGKVVIVTGANQGLGLKVAEELARRHCTLYMLCRNPERGAQAVNTVKASSGNSDVHLRVCDLSSLDSIASFAKEFQASGSPLHVLINNAGVMVQERQLSADGYDVNFATNTLGVFAITYLLGPVLQRSAPSKVIMVSSGGMLTQPLDISDLQNERMSKYDGTEAYAKDKRRVVALAERFAELWTSAGVGVYSMHPGWATTDGVKKAMPGFHKFYESKFRDVGQGADTIVWLALQDVSALTPGAFYLDRSVQPKHLSGWLLGHGTEYNSSNVDALWEKLLALSNKVVPQKPSELANTMG